MMAEQQLTEYQRGMVEVGRAYGDTLHSLLREVRCYREALERICGGELGQADLIAAAALDWTEDDT